MIKPIQVKETTKIAKAPAPQNDVMYTPVPDRSVRVTPPACEANLGEVDLFKQANNPLGDPHKIRI